MKLLIAFMVCIVAVFAGEEVPPLTAFEKKVGELYLASSKACIKELKLGSRYVINDDYRETSNQLTPSEQACLTACVDKNMGPLTADGTYSLEKILTLVETPEDKERVTRTYTNKIKECPSIVGNDVCKLAACVHGFPRSTYMKTDKE